MVGVLIVKFVFIKLWTLKLHDKSSLCIWVKPFRYVRFEIASDRTLWTSSISISAPHFSEPIDLSEETFFYATSHVSSIGVVRKQLKMLNYIQRDFYFQTKGLTVNETIIVWRIGETAHHTWLEQLETFFNQMNGLYGYTNNINNRSCVIVTVFQSRTVTLQ